MLWEKIWEFLETSEKPVIEILGPTASGKTDFTVQLAKKLGNSEAIVVDSRQVFRGCDISAAKITEEEMGGVVHHGIDLCDPGETMTVVDFKQYGEKKIQETLDRGNIPILSGGTMLWLDAISENYIFDETPRVKSQKKGEPIFDFFKIGIEWDREKLYERINGRAVWQFENGLIEETKKFMEADASQSFLTSFGYLEIMEYLRGDISYEEALAKNQQRNRNYAKRQLTWWRGREDVLWVDGEKLREIF